MPVTITAVEGMPEVRAGDDLAALIHAAAERQGLAFEDGDVIVVTQKAVSKAEGRLVGFVVQHQAVGTAQVEQGLQHQFA